jgi:hypothetical protein
MEGLIAGDVLDVSLGDVMPTFLQNSAVCLQVYTALLPIKATLECRKYYPCLVTRTQDETVK